MFNGHAVGHGEITAIPAIGAGEDQPPLWAVNHNFNGNLPPVGAVHRGVECTDNLIGRRADPQGIDAGSYGRERNRDHDADDADDDHDLDEGQAALRSPPLGHFAFQLTMSSFISVPPGWPSAP